MKQQQSKSFSCSTVQLGLPEKVWGLHVGMSFCNNCRKNRRGQSSVWKYSFKLIPIILLCLYTVSVMLGNPSLSVYSYVYITCVWGACEKEWPLVWPTEGAEVTSLLHTLPTLYSPHLARSNPNWPIYIYRLFGSSYYTRNHAEPTTLVIALYMVFCCVCYCIQCRRWISLVSFIY